MRLLQALQAALLVAACSSTLAGCLNPNYVDGEHRKIDIYNVSDEDAEMVVVWSTEYVRQTQVRLTVPRASDASVTIFTEVDGFVELYVSAVFDGRTDERVCAFDCEPRLLMPDDHWLFVADQEGVEFWQHGPFDAS